MVVDGKGKVGGLDKAGQRCKRNWPYVEFKKEASKVFSSNY